MYMEEIGTDERVTYLIKPIISVLKEAGGQLIKSEIRNRICEKDERIAEFEQRIYTSKKTGNKYRKFDFSFNFAIKELGYTGFINYEKNNLLITLTEKGDCVDITHFDAVKEVREKDNREEILMSLRNQKCLLYKNTVNTMEPQSKANEYYREFNIKCPLHFIKNTTGKLTPIYHLEKHTQDM